MNTSGLLQSNVKPEFHEPSKIEFIAYIYSLLKYLIYRFFFHNLGDKTILYLIFNRINGFVGVQNRKAEQPM